MGTVDVWALREKAWHRGGGSDSLTAHPVAGGWGHGGMEQVEGDDADIPVEGLRPPEKLIKGFRTMVVVLQMYPPSLQATIYYLRAVLNAAEGYQAMHLPRWQRQLGTIEAEVRRLIRGYEGVPREVPSTVLRAPQEFYGEVVPGVGRRTAHIQR